MSRAADYTIKGFLYQFNKTLLDILNSPDGSNITVEGIVEDVEIETSSGMTALAARVLWKLKKAYSLGIPKKKLARGKSQTEEEHAYGEEYTICGSDGRVFWT